MTPTREAIILPASFLTVALLGGLRLAPAVRLVPPSLVSLVLAVMLMVCLVRAGAFVPQAAVSAERSNLENSSGLAVLLTLFAASAQIFTLVTPESSKSFARAASYAVRRPGKQEPESWRLAQARRELGVTVPAASPAKSYAV